MSAFSDGTSIGTHPSGVSLPVLLSSLKRIIQTIYIII
jgi:hypothetical protein